LRTAVGASVEVHLNLASDLLPAICDTRQLESALVNLAVNARDAMPTGGILAIETANAMLMGEFASLRPGWYASICVSDTGTGMAAETLERAFDPYFTTKPKGLGTGLGLSTTRAFACRFGGHVDASSAPGEGTSVRLYLPCAEGSAV
jgi:signal transduction histidine kinase